MKYLALVGAVAASVVAFALGESRGELRAEQTVQKLQVCEPDPLQPRVPTVRPKLEE